MSRVEERCTSVVWGTDWKGKWVVQCELSEVGVVGRQNSRRRGGKVKKVTKRFFFFFPLISRTLS